MVLCSGPPYVHLHKTDTLAILVAIPSRPPGGLRSLHILHAVPESSRKLPMQFNDKTEAGRVAGHAGITSVYGAERGKSDHRCHQPTLYMPLLVSASHRCYITDWSCHRPLLLVVGPVPRACALGAQDGAGACRRTCQHSTPVIRYARMVLSGHPLIDSTQVELPSGRTVNLLAGVRACDASLARAEAALGAPRAVWPLNVASTPTPTRAIAPHAALSGSFPPVRPPACAAVHPPLAAAG